MEEGLKAMAGFQRRARLAAACLGLCAPAAGEDALVRCLEACRARAAAAPTP